MGVLQNWYGGYAQGETSYLIGGLSLDMIPVMFILDTGFPSVEADHHDERGGV